MWIFGYGSLIWKIDFEFSEKVRGYIKGHQRKFWQGSEDHRGVPGKPGRVVTLVESTDKEDCVWGYAYYINADYLDHLDHREKGGYKKKKVTFYPHSNEENCHDSVKPFELDIYIGSADNPHYLGPAPMSEMGQQIALSEGPSGRNVDYLLELAAALRHHFPHAVLHYDQHLFDLEREVLKQARAFGIQLNGHPPLLDRPKERSPIPNEEELE